MNIRKMIKSDIPPSAEIMCSVYNNELWQCRWTIGTAEEYLNDFFDMKKFIGFVLFEKEQITGGIFAHEKAWWNNSEVFIEEMFIHPDFQRKGYGSLLLDEIEKYVKENKLAGVTLSTNKYAPAPLFYRKNGFTDCEHVIFMAKET